MAEDATVTPEPERRLVAEAAERMEQASRHTPGRGGEWLDASDTADAVLASEVGEPEGFRDPYFRLARQVVAVWQRLRGRERRARQVTGEAARPPKARSVSSVVSYGTAGERELYAP